MKKHLTNSFYYLLIGFLPLASNFLLTPFFTRFLSPEEYGILALAALFQSYLTIFISCGLDSAFNRFFFTYYRRPLILNSFFTTILCSVAAISALCSILLYLIGDWLLLSVFGSGEFTFSGYGAIVLTITITSLLHAIALAFYRNLENLKAFAILAVSFFICMTLGSVIGVIVLELGAWGSLTGRMTGALLVVIIYLLYFFTNHALVFRLRFLKSALGYGLPVVPYVLIGITLDNLDRFFIERYISLAALGKYNIAFLIASVAAIFLQSVSSAVNPAIYKLLETNNRTRDASSLHEVNMLFKGTHIFILVLIAGAVIVGEPLVLVLIDKKYHDLAAYLPLLFLAYVPRVYYVIFALPLFFHHKTRFLPAINLLALIVGGVFMFLFLQWWGILGVCLGVIVIKSVQTISALLLVKNTGYYVPVMFSMRSNHLLSLVLCVLVLAGVWLGYLYPQNRILYSASAGFIFLLITVLVYGSQLRELLNKVALGLKLKR